MKFYLKLSVAVLLFIVGVRLSCYFGSCRALREITSRPLPSDTQGMIIDNDRLNQLLPYEDRQTLIPSPTSKPSTQQSN